MSNILINHSKITGNILKNNGRLEYLGDTDIDKCEKGDLALIELKGFGISQVYSLISIDKIKEFKNKVAKIRKLDIPATLSISRIYRDDPIVEGFNKKSKSISINNLPIDTWISLYQLNSLIDGMNQYSELTINNQIDYEFDIDNSKDIFPDFGEDIDYKYIFMIRDFEDCGDSYVCSNILKNQSFTDVYIKIPGFNLWQKFNTWDLKSFDVFNSIDIRYAITDDPRCFSKVGYYSEFYASNLEELLSMCVYMPMDIYFDKIFSENESPSKLQDGYDALEVCVHNEDYNTTVLLTHKELGIDFNGESAFWYHDKKKCNRLQYMDKFCLLTLIRNVISLKPYK